MRQLIIFSLLLFSVSCFSQLTPTAANVTVSNIIIDTTKYVNQATFNVYNQAGVVSSKSYNLPAPNLITIDTVAAGSGNVFFTAAKRVYFVKAVTASPILYASQATMYENEMYTVKVDSITGGFTPYITRTGVDINFRFNNGALATFFYLKIGTYYLRRIGASVFVDYVPQLLSSNTANRPTLNIYNQGQFYFNTAGYYEVWDGTAWNIFNTSGYVAKSANYTVTQKDNIIEITADATTQTLLSAVGIAGKEYTFKLTAVGTATIATTSSQLIDAATTYTLSAQNKYVKVVSNGTKWLIVAQN